jgi:hypothetical protein
MDSVLTSEFRTALRHHQGTVTACCLENELSLHSDTVVTIVRALRRSSGDYAFSLPVKETLERLGERVFFHFEPGDDEVVVEGGAMNFEKTALPQQHSKLECKAVVRGEDLAQLSEMQFVGKQVIFALEQTFKGTSLILTDGYSLHRLDLSISPGNEKLVTTTPLPFNLFRRGAVEVLCNDRMFVLKQNGLEVQLKRKGAFPDYKSVLQTLRLYEQVQLPAKALQDHLEPFKKDKKKQVSLTLQDNALALDGAKVCQVKNSKSLMLSVLASLAYDALSETGSVDLFLTGNNTPFIVRSQKRWTLLVPIPAQQAVRGTGVTLAEALEPLPTLAQAA